MFVDDSDDPVLATILGTRRGDYQCASLFHPYSVYSHAARYAHLGDDVYNHLRLFGEAWESANKKKLESIIMSSAAESFFNPDQPEALRHAVALGVVDFLCRLLLADPSWLPTLPDTYKQARDDPYNSCGLSSIYLYICRLLVECIVVNNNVAWYVVRKYPHAVARLFKLMEIPLLFDVAATCFEHILSIVGPVVRIDVSSQLVTSLESANDSNFASLNRAVALLLVPGVMSVGDENKTAEPFPQCLTRMRAGEAAASRNITTLLGKPHVLNRILTLIGYKPKGIRIFHGNRTTTMVPPTPEEVQQQHQVLRRHFLNLLASQMIPSFPTMPQDQQQQIITMVESIPGTSAMIQTAINNATQTATAAGGGGGAGGAAGGGAEGEAGGGGNDQGEGGPAFFADEDDDVDWDGAEVDPFFMGMAEEMQPPVLVMGPGTAPASLPPSGSPPSSGGAATGSAAGTAPANATGNNNSQNGGGGNGVNLQQIAEALSGELPETNEADRYAFASLTGKVDPHVVWRLRTPHLNIDDLNRRLPMTKNRKRLEDKYFTEFKDRKVYGETPASLKTMQEQGVVNAQSELLFVLAGLVCGADRHRAWELMAELRALDRIAETLDFHLRIDESSDSYSHIVNTNSDGLNNGADADVDDLDGAAHHGKKKKKVKGKQSGKKGATSKSAKKQQGDHGKSAADPLRDLTGAGDSSEDSDDTGSSTGSNGEDSDGASSTGTIMTDTITNSGSDDDDEVNEHRHDPDTLRKIELLRFINELWCCQEVLELERLLRYPSIRQQAPAIANKLLKFLSLETEDSCAETQALHCLESYIRSYGREERPAVQSALAVGALPILFRRLERAYQPEPHLATSASRDGRNHITKPSSNWSPLRPQRRLDAMLQLLGELLRYNPEVFAQIDQRLGPQLGVGDIYTAEDRKQNRIGRMLLRYPFESNLFIRAVALTLSADMRATENWLYATQQPELFPPEVSHLVLRRVFYVREKCTFFFHKAVRGEQVMVSDVISAMVEAPGTLPLAMRPILPFANLPGTATAALAQARNAQRLNVARSVPGHIGLPPSPTDPCPAPMMKAFLDEHRAHLLFHFFVVSNPFVCETTERLCVITTALILTMGAIHQKVKLAEANSGTGTAIDRAAIEHEFIVEILRSVVTYQNDVWRKQRLACASNEDEEEGVKNFCILRVMFSGLCVWSAHYSCSQKYLSTFFYCTDVPTGRLEALVPRLLQIILDCARSSSTSTSSIGLDSSKSGSTFEWINPHRYRGLRNSAAAGTEREGRNLGIEISEV